jgi:hypothetical protein
MRNVSTDIPLDELFTIAFTAWKLKPGRLTNLVAVGSIGSAGGMSIVNLPSPNAVFQDIAADGFILPEDIPAGAAPAD